MAIKKLMKGVSYGRVSTVEQAFYSDGTRKEDASPQMQKKRCQRYVDFLDNEKACYQIIEHLSDDGFSGGTTKRPSFQKLIDYVKSGKIDFVIATELSRLSRNTYDFLDFFNLCSKHNVDVIIIDLKLDTTSPYGKFVMTILMALAEFEKNVTRERVKQNAKARLISDGKINGATEILGLDKCSDKKGHYVINVNEVEMLKRVFNIFLLTGSRAETLREINGQGIKWKRGEDFSKAKLELIFKNVNLRYKGRWLFNSDDGTPKYIDLPHGPLLEYSLLDEVDKKLNEAKSKKRLPGKSHIYLLSTLLEHEDGSSFSGQPAKKRQYRYYYNDKNKIRIPCADIEKTILKKFEEYISDQVQIKKLIEKAHLRSSEELKELKVKIAEVESDLKNLSRNETVIKDKLLVTNDLTAPEVFKLFENEISQINKSREQLQTQLKVLEGTQNKILEPISSDKFKKTIKQFLSQMTKTPNATHRGMLEKIFHKIVVKETQEIEMVMYGHSVGENKTTRSSSGGLIGGSTGT